MLFGLFFVLNFDCVHVHYIPDQDSIFTKASQQTSLFSVYNTKYITHYIGIEYMWGFMEIFMW